MTVSRYDYPVDHKYLKELGAPEEYLLLLTNNRVKKGYTILSIIEKTGHNTGTHNTFFNGKGGYPTNIMSHKFGLTGAWITTANNIEYVLRWDQSTDKYIVKCQIK